MSPKVDAATFSPAEYPEDPDMEWCALVPACGHTSCMARAQSTALIPLRRCGLHVTMNVIKF